MVVLTQDPLVAEPRRETLRAAGFESINWPLTRLQPGPEHELAPVLRRLDRYHAVVLPSPGAVRIVAGQLRRLRLIWPPGVPAALIGPGSAEAFDHCFGAGLARIQPAGPPADGAHLATALRDHFGGGSALGGDADPVRLLVLHRPDGRTAWIEALRGAGFHVDVVDAYTARPEPDPPVGFDVKLAALRARGGPVIWQIGTAVQLGTLRRWLDTVDDELAGWVLRADIEVPHPAVAAAAESPGFTNVRVADLGRPLTERLQYARQVEPADPASGAGRLHDTGARADLPGGDRAASISSTPFAASTDLSAAPNKDRKGGPDSTAAGAGGFAAGTAAGKDVEDAVVRDTTTKTGSTAVDPAAKPPVPAAAATSDGKPADGKSADGKPADKAAADKAAAPADKVVPTADKAPVTARPADSDKAGSAASSRPVPPAAASGPAGGGGNVAAPAGTGSGSRGSVLWAIIVLLVVGLLAVAGWWFAQQRFLALERESAKRLQAADARAGQLEEQLRSLRESQTQLVARSTALESRLSESASQQEQLQALYDDIARTRGESALSEVEESVTLASQHLELTGNVKAALLALEAAQKRLGGDEEGQAIGLRRLVAQDIEKLRALPDVDITRLAARLDEAIDRIDRMPLLADASEKGVVILGAGAPAAPAPAGEAAAPDTPASPAAGEGDAASRWQRMLDRALETTRRGFETVREEFRSLVTIRRIDQPDALLMSPDQKRQTRENLRLLLLNARLALINRQETMFRQDLDRAMLAIRRLFDGEHDDVKSVVATLELLKTQPLVVELPSLAETVGAIRAARAGSESRS